MSFDSMGFRIPGESAPNRTQGTAAPAKPLLMRLIRALLEAVLVVAASLLLGGATSFAQQLLPQALAPFANSPSGWTLLTGVIMWAVVRGSAPWAAILGAAGFVSLLIGYQVVSAMRGYPDSEVFFTVVALVVGPFVGVAARWLHQQDLRAALGVALLAGIGVGDAARGLLFLPMTGWSYWVLIGVLALGLLAFVTLTRMRSAGRRLLAVLGTLLTATAYALTLH